MSGDDRKFYKTVFQIVVLSEDSIMGIALDDIPRFVNEESGVLQNFEVMQETVMNAEEMADELDAAGSTPTFFNIDIEETD